MHLVPITHSINYIGIIIRD
ncbi:TPA: CRISPR-associated DxTHG motif protein [Legionella pneumophila]|nr:CRISPR-associated DxTHG motif protein [Legionella pneumophila]HAT8183308.1 CRISPR-associated DxTHG motif protein [Legionella pneumophila]